MVSNKAAIDTLAQERAKLYDKNHELNYGDARVHTLLSFRKIGLNRNFCCEPPDN
jgi:hypothetical protein